MYIPIRYKYVYKNYLLHRYKENLYVFPIKRKSNIYLLFTVAFTFTMFNKHLLAILWFVNILLIIWGLFFTNITRNFLLFFNNCISN